MAAHAKRFARQFRQSIPGRAPVEWSAERDAGLDALVEGGRARCVVPAQAHAPHSEPLRVEIRALFGKIEHSLHWHFVVTADGEIILRLALAGPLEDQRRHAAREKGCLVGVAFLFCGVEAYRHDDNRWP